MQRIYNFEQKQPPVLTEKMLREEIKRRELKRQTILLRTASVFVCLCFVLFAFFIAPDSMVLAVCSILTVCIALIGNGIISVLFYFKGKGVCLE